MAQIKFLYLCDGKRCPNLFKGKEWRGCGECRHTTDKDHARTGGFVIDSRGGELFYPDNVTMFRHNDGSLIFIEEEDPLERFRIEEGRRAADAESQEE